eukprot:3165460-Alexandrium_andersonii.AAC.1
MCIRDSSGSSGISRPKRGAASPPAGTQVFERVDQGLLAVPLVPASGSEGHRVTRRCRACDFRLARGDIMQSGKWTS